MSVRESIAIDIVESLESVTDPVTPRFVSRQPITSVDLSLEQYPAVFVRAGQEEREEGSMGQSNLRISTIDFTITGFVRAEGELNIDTERNLLIEAIEEQLEVSRNRNDLALNSYVTNITTDEGDQFPIGRVDINYRVIYKYTRGTT